MKENIKVSNNKLSAKLNKMFEKNIKLSFVSELSVIIVNTNDICYEFERKNNKSLLIALNDDDKKFEAFKEKSIVTELSNKKIVEIKSSRSHSIARTLEGQIYFWGHHGLEELSYESGYRKTYKLELIPIPINEKVEDMCCGCDHSLVLTNNGVVYAWGRNNCGQIGNGMSNFLEYKSTPFRLNAFNDEEVKSISCGSYHSMALTNSGLVYSWGRNYCGQLGIGNESNYSSPKLLEISKEICRISCGKYHSLLLTRDQDIYVCGWNWSRELRPWYHWTVSTPIKLSHSEKFTNITSFFNNTFSAAISDKSILYIWGKCGKVVITEPKKTKFNSFVDIYDHYLRMTDKSIDGKLIRFDDDFTQNGRYRKNFDEKNEREIGGGSYGKVFKVCENNSKDSYAIKKVKFKSKLRKFFCGELETSSIISEMRDQKIVKYFNVWLEKYNKKLTLFIQMELCDKSLKEIINEIKKDSNFLSCGTLTSLGYYISIGIFIEILEGVQYLHKNTPIIIHRDLKPDNIMLKINNKNDSFVKIVDLGLAAIHENKDQSHTSDIGTRDYAAPEVKQGRKYDERADIYSLGLILRELLVIDINREYTIQNENRSEFSFGKQYQELSYLCDNMTRQKVDQRSSNITEILGEKFKWNLDANEFIFKKEFKEFSITKEIKDSFFFQLLEKKLAFLDKSHSISNESSE